MLFRLAWRNVLRNKRRTLLSGLAVGIGLAMLIFANAVLEGMLRSMIATATDTFMGQGQIHAEGFRGTLDVDSTIRDIGGVMNGLAHEPRDVLEAYTPRTLSYGMLTSAAGAQAAVIYGLDPVSEPRISRLHEAIIEGEYLSAEADSQVLIGDKMAETLGVRLGDKIVITVAEAHTGELGQELFRVAGIFRFGVREADMGMAYLDIGAARGMLGLPEGAAHEIALRFRDISFSGDEAHGFWARYSRGGNEALGWRGLLPELDGVYDMSWVSTVIILILIFGIVALTVMNTLFMSLYERMFEYGVLRAIGTGPGRMAAVIVLEAASLSVFSMLIGLALGAGITLYFARNGIDYVGIEFAGVTVRDLIHPVFIPWDYAKYPLIVFGFSLAASLYPAIYAARLRPARAMRRSL